MLNHTAGADTVPCLTLLRPRAVTAPPPPADRPERRTPAAVRLFWVRTLHRLVELDRSELRVALARLSQTPLGHPNEGRRRFTRAELVSELRRAGALYRVIDSSFWLYALQPLLDRSGRQVRRAFVGLAGTPLQHPIGGRRRYSRAQLDERLRLVRELDRDELRLALVRQVGPFYERRCRRSGPLLRYADGYALAVARLGIEPAPPW